MPAEGGGIMMTDFTLITALHSTHRIFIEVATTLFCPIRRCLICHDGPSAVSVPPPKREGQAYLGIEEKGRRQSIVGSFGHII